MSARITPAGVILLAGVIPSATSVLVSAFSRPARPVTIVSTRTTHVFLAREMSMHYLAMVTLGALPRASRTRYIELIRCLRLSRAALRSSRRRPSWSRLLLLLCGCVFVLFSLVHCSPVYADDYADPGRITAYTPAGSAFVNVSGGSVAFYSDYLWVTGSDVTQVTNFSTTKGLARKGDILAVSVYVWDNVDTFGPMPVVSISVTAITVLTV